MADTAGIEKLTAEDSRISLDDLAGVNESGLSALAPDVLPDEEEGFELDDLADFNSVPRQEYKQNQTLTGGLNQQSAGEILDISDKSGLSPQLVQQDLPTAKIRAFTPGIGQDLDSSIERFGSNSPYHVALIQSEAPVWNGIINNWNKVTGFLRKTAENVVESHRQGTIGMELNQLYHNKFYNDDDSQDSKIRSLELKLKPVQADDLFQDIVSVTAQTLPQIETALLRGGVRGFQVGAVSGALGFSGGPLSLFTAGVGFAFGFNAGVYEQIFIQESGQAVKEYSEIEGVSPTEAKIAAGLVGTINAAIELTKFRLVLKTIPGGNKILSFGTKQVVKDALLKPAFRKELKKIGLDYITAIIANATEEGLQSIVTDEVGELLKFVTGENPTFTPQKDILKKAGAASIQGLKGGIGLGSFGTGGRVLIAAGQAARAENFYNQQVEVGDQISTTGMKKASPERTEELLSTVEADKEVVIAPEETTALLQENRQELFDKIGISETEIETSLTTGQDIDMRMSTVFAKLNKEEIRDFLQHVREDPNGKSFNEAKAFNLDEAVARQIDIQKEAQVEELELQDNLSRLRNEVRQAGFDKKSSGAISSIWEAYSRRMSLEGQELSELVKRLKIRKATKKDLETVTRIQAEKGDIEDVGFAPLPRGLLLKDNDEFIISLFEGADISTLSHETAHVFFSEIKGLALEHQVPSLEKEWGLIKEWLGSDNNPTVAHEEKFAEGFEQYLLEGKAPTKNLEKVFERFKSWLVEIYGKLVNKDIKLNPDIKGVFDRLLTTEQEVNDFILDNELIPSESVVDGLELTDAQQQVLRGSLQKNGRERTLNTLERRIRKELFKRRPLWKETARTMVDALPVYRLSDDLSQGVIRGFDRGTINELYGKNTGDKLKAKNNRFVVAQFGDLFPEVTLQDYIVEPQTPADLIRELVNAPPKELRQNEMILEFEKDFLKNLTAEESFLSWSDGLTGYLETLGNFISKRAGLEVKPAADFKLEAEKRIAVEPVRDILNTNTALIAMRKALRQKDESIKNGDFAEAERLMNRARFNYEQARASKNLRNDIRRTRSKIRAAVKSKKKMPPAYQENVKALGIRYGFTDGVIRADKPSLKSLISKQGDTDLTAEPVFDDFLLNETDTRPFRDMAVAEYEELAVLVDYLDAKGRFIVKDVLLSQKIKRRELITELTEPSRILKTRRIFNEGSLARTLSGNISNFFAQTDKFVYVMRAMDAFQNIGAKGTPGPNERLLWNAYTDTAAKSFELAGEVDAKMKPALDQLYKSALSFPGNLVEGMPRRPDIWVKQGRQWTFENIVGIARLMGLEDNRKAVVEGFGLKMSEIQQALSILTDADWDAVQTIWDTFDFLWPEMQRIRTEVEFLPTRKLQASPFRTPTGKILEGGYHPLVVDWTLASKIRNNEEIENLKAMYPTMFPTASTRSGSLKVRKGFGGLPPQTDWNVLTKQLNWNQRYITHTELTRDMSRIFARDGEYYNQVSDKLGKPVADLLIGLNKHEAVPDAVQMNKGDRILLNLRSMASVYTLAFNPSVSLKQLFSIPNAVLEFGRADYVKGAFMFLKDPIKNSQLVYELSPFMKERAKGMNREIFESAQSLKTIPKNKFTAKLNDLRRIREFMNWIGIRTMDYVAVQPIWFAAYQKFMTESGGNIQEAVNRADAVIAATQPNNRIIDMSAFQRNPNGWIRLFTMFGSFMFTYGNQQRAFLNAWKSGVLSTFDFADFVLTAAVMPPVLMYLLFQWARDDEIDEKDVLLSIFTYNGGTIPFGRDIINAGAWTYKTGKSSDAFWKSPALIGLDLGQDLMEGIIRMTKDLGSEKKQERAIFALAEFASFTLRVPASRIFRNTKEGFRQYESGDGSFDKLFNIFSPSPEQRREGRKAFTRF